MKQITPTEAYAFLPCEHELERQAEHALSVCRPSHAQSTVDLSMPAAPGTPRWLRAEFEVRSAGSEYEQVHVTLDGLSADQATELAQMLARWAEQ